MKTRTLIWCGSLALLAAGMMQTAHADILTISDEISVVADGNVAPFGIATNYASAGPSSGAEFRYTARERNSTGQTNRRVATFLKFDLSSLSVDDVNEAGFSATFAVEHVGHLNDLNNGMDLMLGQVTGGDWDDEGSLNPDFSWGLGSDNQASLLANVHNFSNSVPLSIDMTSIVQDWVLGSSANQGIALFGVDNGGNASNASYLIDASLTTAVPEPATLSLIGIAGGSLLILRRRFMK